LRITDLSPELPQPKIPYFDKLRSRASEDTPDVRPMQEAVTPPPRSDPKETNSSRPSKMRQDSSSDHEQDPWASPVMQRGLQAQEPAAPPKTNGTSDSATKPSTNGLPNRTTSAFTTHAESPPTNSSGAPSEPPGNGGADSWNSYNGNRSSGFSEQPTLGGGFGQAGDDPGNSSPGELGRSIGGPTRISRSGDETVIITMLPEKEGMFLFQHRNYEVKSVRRGSIVVRRYSDFVWLLDCLQKRYPFRQLPLLPPKRLAGMLNAATARCIHRLTL